MPSPCPFGEPFDALTTRRDGIEEARADLRADPDDTRALSQLAREAAAGPSERIALLKQSLAAHERKLRASEGEDVFESLRGHFWGVLGTRDYMSTRLALAQGLSHHGQIEEALSHFEGMLELCPNDNLLIRPCLASAAIELGRRELAKRVCDQFADDTLCWLPWTRALLQFARGGAEDPKASELLSWACEVNPHVVDYLTGALPLIDPPSFTPGSHEEASFYVVCAERAWAHTPGALGWLHLQREITGARVPRALLPRKNVTRLGGLPQADDTWQVGWRPMPGWIESEQAQPWALVVGSGLGLVLTCDVTTRAPTVTEVWAACTRAMQRPKVGSPSRPKALELDWELMRSLAGPCHALGIEAAPLVDGRQLDQFLSALARDMRGGEETAFPAWTRRPGVDVAQISGVCAATTSFFQQTPWHRVDDGEGFVLSPAGGDAALRLLGEDRPCAVVMGTAGETFGLALYDSEAAARNASDWATNRVTLPCTTVTYDPPGLHHPDDIERFKDLECRLPGDDALPLVFRMEEGDDHPVAPTPTQLARLEVALRLVPVAIEQRTQGASLTVPVRGKGEAQVNLERLLLHPAHSSLELAGGALQPDLEGAFEEIANLVEEFFSAHPHLGSSAASLAAAAMLCSQPDSPVYSGRPRSWAAGVTYAWLRNIGALGHSILADEVAGAFEVSRNTASKKARQVDDALHGLFLKAATNAPG